MGPGAASTDGGADGGASGGGGGAAGQSNRCPRFLSEGQKLIVCCAQKPVRMTRTHQGDAWAYRSSQSGFKSAIDWVGTGNRVQWVSWPGAAVEQATQDAVRKRVQAEHATSPVFISRELQAQVEGFWAHTLWPNLHCSPADFEGHPNQVSQRPNQVSQRSGEGMRVLLFWEEVLS